MAAAAPSAMTPSRRLSRARVGRSGAGSRGSGGEREAVAEERLGEREAAAGVAALVVGRSAGASYERGGRAAVGELAGEAAEGVDGGVLVEGVGEPGAAERVAALGGERGEGAWHGAGAERDDRRAVDGAGCVAERAAAREAGDLLGGLERRLGGRRYRHRVAGEGEVVAPRHVEEADPDEGREVQPVVDAAVGEGDRPRELGAEAGAKGLAAEVEAGVAGEVELELREGAVVQGFEEVVGVDGVDGELGAEAEAAHRSFAGGEDEDDAGAEVGLGERGGAGGEEGGAEGGGDESAHGGLVMGRGWLTHR